MANAGRQPKDWTPAAARSPISAMKKTSRLLKSLGTGCLLASTTLAASPAEDAKAVAEEFNTATTQELTTRIDYRTGAADEGSARQVEEYVVHPNTIRSLPTGMAAVRVRNPHLVVQVQVFKPL